MFSTLLNRNVLNKSVGNILTNGISNLWNAYTGSGLTDQQIMQNEYSTSEREAAQGFEERMSNTAFQRQVADMKEAGVNPAIMYGTGSNGASTPSSSGMSFSGLTSMATISDLIQLATLKPTIENMKANAALTRQKTTTEESESELRKLVVDMYPKLTQAQIDDLIESKVLKGKQGLEADAVADFTRAKETFQKFENENYDDLLVLKKACLRAEAGEKNSEAALADARKAAQDLESAYMREHGVKMTEAGKYGLILAIADKFGLNPSKLKDFFTDERPSRKPAGNAKGGGSR